MFDGCPTLFIVIVPLSQCEYSAANTFFSSGRSWFHVRQMFTTLPLHIFLLPFLFNDDIPEKVPRTITCDPGV